jgi:hypothetical protein
LFCSVSSLNKTAARRFSRSKPLLLRLCDKGFAALYR